MISMLEAIARLRGEITDPTLTEAIDVLVDAVTVTIGVADHIDDTGLQWKQVVVATHHGDATFHACPSTAEGDRIAEATADHLVWLFDVLGIKAERGEVDHA